MQIQGAYARAGSDVVCALTAGANRASLARYGVTAPIPELCAALVSLSRQAVEGRCLIAGDIAPTGLMHAPGAGATEEELLDLFTEQAGALENAGVDLFFVEAQVCAREAMAALRAVRTVSSRPLLVSFTCGAVGRTPWGEALWEILEDMQDLGVDAFGINCCGDLKLLVRTLNVLKPIAAVPLIAKPSAGFPRVENGRTRCDMTPAELAAAVPALLESGAQLFGGCCGTDEQHIAAIKAAIARLD